MHGLIVVEFEQGANFIDGPGGCSQRTYIGFDALSAKGNHLPGMEDVSARSGALRRHLPK